MTTTEITAGERFEIEALDLEPHDWDRGIEHIHAIRYRSMTVVIITGPGALQAIGFYRGGQERYALDEASGRARAQHYRMLSVEGKLPPLGPIRGTAGA